MIQRAPKPMHSRIPIDLARFCTKPRSSISQSLLANHNLAIHLVGIYFISIATSKDMRSFCCPNPVTESRMSYQPSTATPTPDEPSYIEDGYNMILTDAPKDLGGRLRRNCARTTPELPEQKCQHCGHESRVVDIPCGLVTFPQMTLILDPLTSFCAR